MIRALAVLVLGGCNIITDSFATKAFSGDPFPIDVDTTSGAIIVDVVANADAPRTAVLDVLSPVTVIERPSSELSITFPTLTLLGERGPGGPLDLPRAQFADPQVLSLHPCVTTTCAVGTPDAPRGFDALIGLDVFSGDALRLRLASDELFILPDVAGDETHRTNACDAVLPTPFRGGGTLVVGGTEVAFTNWRLAVGACLAPNPDPLVLQSARGADALFVLSTALGISLLDASAYQRYRQITPTAPPLDALPLASVNLPSGPVTGYLANLPGLALVGNSSSSPRAPCRQVYASHLLAQRDCTSGDDCPCTGTDTFCGVPAVVELAPATGIDVLVVGDDDATLQALRTELRPDQPEVDGILGTAALRALELDIDYLHDRMLGRCTDATVCTARPELTDTVQRIQIDGCLNLTPPAM